MQKKMKKIETQILKRKVLKTTTPTEMFCKNNIESFQLKNTRETKRNNNKKQQL